MKNEAQRAGADPAQVAAPEDAAVGDTEDLLNGLIEECRALIQLMAFQAKHPDQEGRMRTVFVDKAMELMRTGADIGGAVAKLRGGTVEEKRQRYIVEHIGAPPKSGREGEG